MDLELCKEMKNKNICHMIVYIVAFIFMGTFWYILVNNNP